MAIFMILFSVLNIVGGVGALIWLVILGEWRLVGLGVAGLLGGTFLISIALMPGLVLAAPMALMAQRGRMRAAVLAGLPSLLWTYLVMGVWCIGSFVVLVPTRGDALPYVLWAYAVATGPWSYMAAKEGQSDPSSYSAVTAFFSQIGCFVLIVFFLFIDRVPALQTMILVYAIPMGLCFLIQLALVASTTTAYPHSDS